LYPRLSFVSSLLVSFLSAVVCSLSLSLSTTIRMDEPTPATTAALPTTTPAMTVAYRTGDTATIVRLLKGGANPNSIDAGGWTPVMRCVLYRHLNAAQELVARGADLSIRSRNGSSVIHMAAGGGDLACVEYVLANTTIDINDTDSRGWTPLHNSLRRGRYEVSKLLLLKGANLFAKDNQGERAIDVPTIEDEDVFMGQQLLDYGKNLKWQSVKQLLLLSKSYSTSGHPISLLSLSSEVAQRKSNRVAASVLANPDLVRNISEFLRRTDIITADPSVEVRDEVRERVEAVLGQV
jgi:ankyrin repeat protein